MASPRSTRRRQRSTRLTVAVALLAFSALAVVGALVSGSWLLVAIAAALGVLLGAAATKITHSELVATRHDAARDRAEQAQAYRRLTDARTAENVAFADAMGAKLLQHEAAVGELEEALSAAQGRAADATRKLNSEARRAESAERQGREVEEQLGQRLTEAEERVAEAVLRVVELEQELDGVRAELTTVTQAWRAAESQRRHA
jgi:chromosome segregation ATPase